MSELRTEILVTNYARRKSGWSAFGQGFDTPRLHPGKATRFEPPTRNNAESPQTWVRGDARPDCRQPTVRADAGTAVTPTVVMSILCTTLTTRLPVQSHVPMKS